MMMRSETTLELISKRRCAYSVDDQFHKITLEYLFSDRHELLMQIHVCFFQLGRSHVDESYSGRAK